MKTNDIKTPKKTPLPRHDNSKTTAKLVSYSQPSDEFKAEGLDDIKDLVAFCARVSNPSNQLNKETNDKLITYLVNHKHWSPLEMASATIEINTTRDIARQILRHRSFSFQEFSQRYADPTKDMTFMLREARLQDTKNRQNSIENDDEVLSAMWRIKQEQVIQKSLDAYTWAVDNGIAKEQARSVLPEGNTMSRMYMSGTIRSWLHYIDLRSSNGTQKEHIEVAMACAEAITKIFDLDE